MTLYNLDLGKYCCFFVNSLILEDQSSILCCFCNQFFFLIISAFFNYARCLQLPATLQPGVTVVISPLLSLIQDQIITLNLKFGIPATFLNSQQTPSQAAVVLQELRQDSTVLYTVVSYSFLLLFLNSST